MKTKLSNKKKKFNMLVRLTRSFPSVSPSLTGKPGHIKIRGLIHPDKYVKQKIHRHVKGDENIFVVLPMTDRQRCGVGNAMNERLLTAPSVS